MVARLCVDPLRLGAYTRTSSPDALRPQQVGEGTTKDSSAAQALLSWSSQPALLSLASPDVGPALRTGDEPSNICLALERAASPRVQRENRDGLPWLATAPGPLFDEIERPE